MLVSRLGRATCFVVLVVCCARANAEPPELRWSSEGYFRTRAVGLTNLAPQDRRIYSYPINSQPIVVPDIRHTTYLMSRLRIMPTLSYGDLAALKIQVDALDDVLWGDNNGVASSPLFAGDGSNQYFLGGDFDGSVRVPRAWVEFKVPIGAMRVGRMPSHWGLGLVANGGGTGNIDPLTPEGEPERKALDSFFDDDFGDNHFGLTADRILFVTKPITIAKVLGGTPAEDAESNLIIGYAFDKLSEAPLLPAEGFERRFRPYGQQGFISRSSDDDVNEHVALILYNAPDWNPVAYSDDLRLGLYGIYRHADEGSTQPSTLDPSELCGTFAGQPVRCVDTGSDVWIVDVWWRLRYGPYYTEGEAYKIGGETFGGVPFPGKNRKKKANITGGVARVGYMLDNVDGILEIGHASGDEALEDEEFKQRGLHPDFNVGLILFEETLRELTARTYGPPFFSPENPEGAKGFFSDGGVINANYLHPKVRYRPGVADLEVVGALLFAWVDELARTGTATFYADETDSSYLGTELDVAIKASFSGAMTVSLESGLLFFGPALQSALPNADTSFTLQSRVAFVW